MAQAEGRHFSERLDRADLRHLMDGMADLIIELDAQGWVVGLSAAEAFDGQGWLGKELRAIVCPDSREKAGDLAARPSALDAGCWGMARHVNLVGKAGDSLPFLLRPFILYDAGQSLHLLVGRDLAPESRMQRQFEAAQQVMIRDYETRLQRIQDRYQRDLRASSIAEAAGRVGLSPLEQILAAFTRRLRRQCAVEALAQAKDDYRGAAALLGITVEELDAILTLPTAE